ncbi:MAG: RNA polymerase sigma-54 factor, partial [Muribaculaceae bacterium]|nr:RNA polymerase sigma-54 factor [Muribaculaceae bacterium]
FVATGWGILPLRHFFSDSIGEGTDLITNRRIEAEIEKIIVEEDKRHPLSDDKLCQVLHEKGFDISRRTVAKYRDRKKIPVARLRKIL